ncbi:hypothetical protein SAMN06265349_101540 [Flavobacterium resistens]|uniref:Uncharacterized protein n=1 Tax=Flavobacterium resistens TaxID=443612 RepID=A0A521AYN0_9FLAO|nr:hypothetical protein [Flavobacterium resistens]MRX68445.1 hypothetical protein [Flavobacterium resistens]SMO39925.1 hypothetical protein SAMN06265349_101540 [Flavobacterium resistens]
MKKICILLFLFFHLITYSQKIVSFKNIGVIFPKDYDCYFFDNLKRFTPTANEINELEILLNKNIEVINTNKFTPLIHENLNNYNRQYIGIFNEKGEKVIYINFLWRENPNHPYKRNKEEKWKTEWSDVADGGSYYWNIKYNLTNKTFFNFRVNTLG